MRSYASSSSKSAGAPCTPRGGDDAALLPQVVDEYAHVGGRVDRGGVDWMIVGLHGRMVATVMLRLAAPVGHTA
jgi:hypothetical protein